MKYLNDVTKDCVGKVCKSLNSGDFKIVKYNDNRNVEIQFLNTGYETSVELVQVKRGNVKDRYLPSVYGIGIIGDKYQVSEGGKNTKEYVLWQSMLERCYSDSSKKKNQRMKVVKCLKTLNLMNISMSGVTVKLGLRMVFI